VIDHRGTEAQRKTARSDRDDRRDPLTQRVIGLAIEIHRALGPGLLESVYEECLAFEFKENGVPYRRQVSQPITYKSVTLGGAYRMDFVVDEALVVGLKTVERLSPVHDAQLLSYMKLSGLRTGLLLNFHCAVLKDGIKRLVL
jgi:GxxExxY protein